MPTGPRGERRPADVIGAAFMVAKIATGEIEDHSSPKSDRVRSGRAGAKARAQNLAKSTETKSRGMRPRLGGGERTLHEQ